MGERVSWSTLPTGVPCPKGISRRFEEAFPLGPNDATESIQEGGITSEGGELSAPLESPEQSEELFAGTRPK